jgi:hypothetical protein
VLSAVALSNAAVDVTFDEAVSAATAESEANYGVSLGIGNPLSALRDGGNPALVHLTFSPLSPNTYLLTVNGVGDLFGNLCVDERENFVVGGVAEGILGLVRSADLLAPVTDWNMGTAECPDTAAQWFLLRNFGTAILTVTPPMAVAGPQFLTNNNCVTIFSLNPGQVSTCSLRVRFAAAARGAYGDTLRIQTNAANAVGGLLKILLTGTWAISPDEPAIVVRRTGNDAQLLWSRVRQSVSGCALTTESYNVFVHSVFEGTYDFLGQTADSTFLHVGAMSNGGRNFYKVTAVDN